jgi:NADH-quinone oxidoreductase subunit C
MTREQLIDGLQSRFQADILSLFDKSPKRIYVEIKPDAMVPLATYIFRDLKARFHIATGVDAGPHLEVLYHFSVEDLNLLLTLRVRLDRQDPRVASLAPVFKGANWIEREMHELLGIDFQGHPDLRRLLLVDKWPRGVYPLRRDYGEWDPAAVRDRGV